MASRPPEDFDPIDVAYDLVMGPLAPTKKKKPARPVGYPVRTLREDVQRTQVRLPAQKPRNDGITWSQWRDNTLYDLGVIDSKEWERRNPMTAEQKKAKPTIRSAVRTPGQRMRTAYEDATGGSGTGIIGRLQRSAEDMFDTDRDFYRQNLRLTPEQAEQRSDAIRVARTRAERERWDARDAADPAFREGRSTDQNLLQGLAYMAGDAGGNASPLDLIGGPAKNVLLRVATQAGLSGGTDAVLQGLEIGEGVRDDYDPVQTALATGTGAATQGIGEAAAAGVRRIRGRNPTVAEAIETAPPVEAVPEPVVEAVQPKARAKAPVVEEVVEAVEPEKVSKYAGSINTQNLKLTPETEEILRGIAPDKETRSRAATEDESLSVPDELPDIGDVSATLKAGKDRTEQGLNEVVRTQNEFGRGSPEHEAAVYDLLGTVDTHSRNASETGRGLNILSDGRKTNVRGEVEGLSSEEIKAISQIIQDPKTRDKFFDFVDEHGHNPEALRKIKRDLQKPKFADWVRSGVYNSMLSGPQSQSRNIVGTLQNILGDLYTHGFASVLGQPRKLLSESGNRVMGREVLARSYGMTQGVVQGFKNFGKAYKEGTPLDQLGREGSGSPFHGPVSQVLEVATRTMAATDEVFRNIAHQSALYGLATRRAVSEGNEGWGKGSSLFDRVDEIIAGPSEATQRLAEKGKRAKKADQTPAMREAMEEVRRHDELLTDAADYAKEKTFRDPPGFFARGVEAALADKADDAIPTQALKLGFRLTVLPFVRTPSSIIRTAARNSPLGLLSSQNWKDFAAGGARRDLALTRVATGTAVTGAVASMAAAGNITGMGPADYRKKQELEASGWRQNSVKIGDKYISYEGLGPMSALLSTTATGVERYKAGEIKGDDWMKTTGSMSLGVADALLHNGWTQGLADFFGAVTAKEGEATSRWANFIGGVASLPVPAVLRQVNQTYIDPVKRDTTGDGSLGSRIAGRVQSGVPGLSDNLPASHDPYGQEIVREKGILDIINPVSYSTETKDPAIAEGVALSESNPEGKALVTPNPRTIPELGRLTSLEYQNYQTLSGEYVRKGIEELSQDPLWKELSPDEKRSLIGDLVKDGRKWAREELFSAPATPEAAPAEGGEEFKAGIPTSMRRTPKGNAAVGGKPNSKHLDGDGIDFIPAPGVSWSELVAEAKDFFGPTARVIYEGDHVHVQMEGLNAPYFGKEGTK